MYLALSAQYQSFRDPAVMLVSVPMSLAGALLFFALGVVSMNIYTQIGLLALTGSIIRHGILLVEFASDIQAEESLDRREAMEKAASLRLWAILMTTVATIVGLIPLLLSGGGPGAESRFAISFTLGVGMALGTVFTLFVVPTLYTVVAKDRRRASEPRAPLSPTTSATLSTGEWRAHRLVALWLTLLSHAGYSAARLSGVETKKAGGSRDQPPAAERTSEVVRRRQLQSIYFPIRALPMECRLSASI